MAKSLREALTSSNTPICPYCGKAAMLVTGKFIYPSRPDLYGLKFWRCPCVNAYVGCHKPTSHNGFNDSIPLGRLADFQLRHAKVDAHKCFDKIWQSGYKTRTEAYEWLAKQLGIPVVDCHIGMFDVDMCNRVKAICADYWMR